MLPASYRLSGPAVQSELLIVSLSTVQMKYDDYASWNKVLSSVGLFGWLVGW
jgi:hypothetical protein